MEEEEMDFLVRRGRGLDPAVLAWLMGTLGVGPGIGEVHFVVGEDTAYYSWLRDDMRMNSSLIHHGILAGEDALTAGRNDVLCVYPGSHVQSTTALTWDKAGTHMLGVAPIQVMEHTVEITNGDADATPTTGNWVFSAAGCVIKNVCFKHRGAAANVVNAHISGDNLRFENVNFHTAANAATAGAAGVKGVFLDGTNQTVFKRCVFGGTAVERTAAAADMTWDGVCDNLFFYDCMWVADLDATADAAHALIEIAAAGDLAKYAYMENPVFMNAGAAQDQTAVAIVAAGGITGQVVMQNPIIAGILDIITAAGEGDIWIVGPSMPAFSGADPTVDPTLTVGIAINANVA